MATQQRSPDDNAVGLAEGHFDPLRYDGHTDDPHEAAGILRRLVPSDAKVLDVGCGTGSLTVIANQGKGNTVFGLEPDAERAAAAEARGVNVFRAELSSDFLDEHGPFDAIIFADVLEHLPSPANVVKLAVSGLKPGGLLLVSVPNVAHWSVRLYLLFGRFNYEEAGIMDATHLRWFTRKTIRALLEGCGLTIVSDQPTAGTGLPLYYRPVFRIFPRRVLERLIYIGTAMFPTLFGCQFVVVARKP